MEISIPETCLVALVGASGSGKSTFARTHFKPTEVLSSDFFRGLVSDDENNQEATRDAFDTLFYVAGKRLQSGRLSVIDATNAQPDDRKKLLALAREHDYLAAAIVFNLPEAVCHARNSQRPDRDFGRHVVMRQARAVRRSIRSLKREGFRHVHVLNSEQEVEDARVVRTRLWANRTDIHGPFDIIGDIHGCFVELTSLLDRLGYRVAGHDATPPDGRTAIFLGDLVDRGPDSPAVLRLVMNMVSSGRALCVPGNHDMKLLKKLNGKNVQVTHGLGETIAQMESQPPEFHAAVRDFMDGLVSHYVLDDGKLTVAHGGMIERYQGRASGRVRAFALFGETTGESDEFGLPVRYNWAADYRGRSMVVYGHTPVPEPEWLNRTINIDTGCVFGGKLTALRYPEKELVSVSAACEYAKPARPLAAVTQPSERRGDVLDIGDVTGRRVIRTQLGGNVGIREGQSAAALEVMSRFAIDPRWIIYLPPTMSPTETTRVEGLLEHPIEAFAYYRKSGVREVVCEEKHMGSRAVIVVCRDASIAARRFGVRDGSAGACYTRTGRAFFTNATQERELLERIRATVDHAGFWGRFNTDWMCLDCEVMPWSAKAIALVKDQYAAVGAAAQGMLDQAANALEYAAQRGIELGELQNDCLLRRSMIMRYRDAYRRYCWNVNDVSDLTVAPFHILASEGHVHIDRDHLWHMEMAQLLNTADEEVYGGKAMLATTPHRSVAIDDDESVNTAVEWWTSLTDAGGEGMVVKPKEFIVRGRRGLVQPAVKCRGPDYLRIIYGPEYSIAKNLERLRSRGLSRKRALALREFALGVEALNRFVQHDALYRVHECVFGVLALESEEVDPRL